MPSATSDSAALLHYARHKALRCGHRALILLSGEKDWCRRHLAVQLETFRADNGLWSCEAPCPQGFKPALQRPDRFLGGSYDALVFDAHQHFDANAFGALSGTIQAGGLIWMICPPDLQWPGGSRFLQRLSRILRQYGDTFHSLQQGVVIKPPSDTATPITAGSTASRHHEQNQAIDAIIAQSKAASSPLVLTANRGRGKSAALGLAAKQLPANTRIVLSAPRKSAVDTVLQHAGEAADRLQFFAPDALLSERPKADLLMVDEAAAIPTPMLAKIVGHYPSAVFATTEHGYEGNGRGFAVRFRAYLDQHHSGWREIRLTQAMRWMSDDPVEALSFRLLLLDAEPAEPSLQESSELHLERLDRDELAADETQLHTLFGLLVLAHYRTRPSDLLYLLDDPGVSVFVARQNGLIVAAAILAEEGGFDEELAFQVWAGRRRPKGHLLAQSLAAHIGLAHGAGLRCARIVRIAVHPQLQSRGIGTHLIRHCLNWSREQGIDLLGSSFGVTEELLDFWQKNALVPVHIGIGKDAASGTHTAVMLKGLSNKGTALQEEAQQRFSHNLHAQLQGPLNTLDKALTARLPTPDSCTALNRQDWDELCAFGFAHRGLELSLGALERLYKAFDWPEDERQHLAHYFHGQAPTLGRKQQLKQLRSLVAKALLRWGDAQTQALVARLQDGSEPE